MFARCSACQFMFDERLTFLDHLKNLCEEEFHKLSNFICPVCRQDVQGCSTFIDHLLIHNSTDNASLPSSKRQTSRPINSTSKAIQNGSKPFKCDGCSSSFSTKSNLKQHSLTHKREDSFLFNCSVCQKSFYSRSSLKLHFRVHNNYCPFKCEFVGCTENFRTKKLMKTHIRRAHFGITTTNKRQYSASDAQRVIQKLAELSGKKTEELPLKKSVNSAFSSLPTRRVEPATAEKQRQLGRASLDITQFPPLYYNANCIQIQSANNIMPRRVGSANFLFPNVYGYRN